MNIFTFPLVYLTLKDESGKRLFSRNLIAIVLITTIISFPFLIADASFFGEKGFLDRIGGFSAVLTGFYIAALVGIASFSSSVGDLDEVIVFGPILRANADGSSEPLTRREYACAIFGYLSFMSLSLSIGSIVLIVLASARAELSLLIDTIPIIGVHAAQGLMIFRIITIVTIALIVAHLFVTTCHGLYYMMDRLYYKNARLLKKPAARGQKANELAEEDKAHES